MVFIDEVGAIAPIYCEAMLKGASQLANCIEEILTEQQNIFEYPKKIRILRTIRKEDYSKADEHDCSGKGESS